MARHEEKPRLKPPKRQFGWSTRLRGYIHMRILVRISALYGKWTGDVIKEPGIFALPFNLILKWTTGTREEEALSMNYAHKMGLPVPRAFSYGEYYDKSWPEGLPIGSIVMERLPGITLDYVLQDISPQQREVIATELSIILQRMRRFANPFGEKICNVTGGEIRTVRATDMTIPPCANFATFHEQIAWAANPGTPDYDTYRESYDRLLKKPYDVVFTHGDLFPHNIMVKDGRVTGLIDWESAGWLPEYWDLTSMLRGPMREEGDAWLDIWRSIAINEYEDEYDSEFGLWMITQDSWSYG